MFELVPATIVINGGDWIGLIVFLVIVLILLKLFHVI